MSSNPFTDYYQSLGLAGMNNPNPYLEFTGQIPLAGYQGVPTDASGKPIQSYLDWQKSQPAQGTTLNSTPAAAAAPQQPQGMTSAQAWQIAQQMGQSAVPGNGRGGNPVQSALDFYNQLYRPMPQQQSQTQPGAATQASAPQAADARQAYLSALANPGQVTTPGAQMYPGASPTGAPQPSVLAHFLATQGGKTGAGGYSNMPFFNTLNQLQAAKAGAS